MKTLRTAVALAGVLLAASETLAQTASSTKPASEATSTPASTASGAAPAESPLVKAAKDGAAKRTKKSRLSIDDKDVKKSSGKLIETTSKPLAPIPAATDVEAELRAKIKAEQGDQSAEKILENRVAAAQKNVESLESELRRLEETYYDEDDPDFREDVISKKFDDTKAKLEKAKQSLEEARNAAAGSGAATP